MGGDCNGRGTSNADQRGNTTDRQRRREWLLKTYASNIEGQPTCRCYRCGVLLTEATMTIDRILPGKAGGGYRRNNIRPACGPCNIWRGNQR